MSSRGLGEPTGPVPDRGPDLPQLDRSRGLGDQLVDRGGPGPGGGGKRRTVGQPGPFVRKVGVPASRSAADLRSLIKGRPPSGQRSKASGRVGQGSISRLQARASPIAKPGIRDTRVVDGKLPKRSASASIGRSCASRACCPLCHEGRTGCSDVRVDQDAEVGFGRGAGLVEVGGGTRPRRENVSLGSEAMRAIVAVEGRAGRAPNRPPACHVEPGVSSRPDVSGRPDHLFVVTPGPGKFSEALPDQPLDRTGPGPYSWAEEQAGRASVRSSTADDHNPRLARSFRPVLPGPGEPGRRATAALQGGRPDRPDRPRHA